MNQCKLPGSSWVRAGAGAQSAHPNPAPARRDMVPAPGLAPGPRADGDLHQHSHGRAAGTKSCHQGLGCPQMMLWRGLAVLSPPTTAALPSPCPCCCSAPHKVIFSFPNFMSFQACAHAPTSLPVLADDQHSIIPSEVPLISMHLSPVKDKPSWKITHLNKCKPQQQSGLSHGAARWEEPLDGKS